MDCRFPRCSWLGNTNSPNSGFCVDVGNGYVADFRVVSIKHSEGFVAVSLVFNLM